MIPDVIINDSTVRVWLHAEDDGDSLFIRLVNDIFAHDDGNDHWLEWCLSEEPFETWFGLHAYVEKWGKSVQQFLLENGIAPGQKFYAELTYHYTPPGWAGCEPIEPDASISMEILHVAPWTDDETLGSWCRWWMTNFFYPGAEFPR